MSSNKKTSQTQPTPPYRQSKRALLVLCAMAYLFAGTFAVALFLAADGSVFLRLLMADVTATLIIFIFGTALRNSSLYDPYWSIAPPLLLLGYAAAGHGFLSGPRETVVALLVLVWALRLTWNCLRRWQNLDEEDFRYIDKRAQSGRFYPLVDLFGIELLPTLLVFLGCLPLYAIYVAAPAPLGLADLAALIITGGAIAIEWHADETLWVHRKGETKSEPLLTGLWGRSRYPNYFGELGFWGGLWLFAMAVSIEYWWTGLGFLAMVLLFRFISIPMMEKRKLERHPAYAETAKGMPLLIPWPRRETVQGRETH